LEFYFLILLINPHPNPILIENVTVCITDEKKKSVAIAIKRITRLQAKPIPLSFPFGIKCLILRPKKRARAKQINPIITFITYDKFLFPSFH